MKRSWLIGAALVFSLTAVGCKDDDEDDDDIVDEGDAGRDAGPRDSGMMSDSGSMDARVNDAGDAAVDGGGDSGRDQ